MNSARRLRALIITLATACVVAIGAGLLGLPATGSASRGNELRLFQHDTSQQYVDVGDPGPSVGDQFVFGGDVSASRGGPKIGRVAGQCTNSSDTEILCSAAFTIGDDQITYQGIADTGRFYGGQPGGTGRYRKASGTLTGRILADSSDAVFTVDLR